MAEMGPVCGDSCRNAYQVEGKEAPCGKCRKVPLPENEEAFRVYSLVQSQVVTVGMGDVVGFDYNALNFIMRLYGVQDRRRVFEKVLAIFNEIRERSKE